MGKIITLSPPGKGAKIAAVDAMTKSVQSHLNGIAAHFDDPKITLVVRTEKGGDLIMTNDEPGAAVAALKANDTNSARNKKVISVDNFGREANADCLICEEVANEALGAVMVDALNADSGEHGTRFYKLVEADYRLWRGMDDLV